MKKILLPLLVAGVMGCGYNSELLYRPASFWDGAKPSLKEKYKIENEVCTKRVYVGKHSVAETYHCKDSKYLTFSLEEQIDTDYDGKVNKACFAELSGYRSPSSTVNREVGCIELSNRRSLSDVANDWLTR